jgi:hypothetical protein
MPAMVTVNDFRWQFIAGDKYWVIGRIRLSGNYVTGGIPLSFEDTRNRFPNPGVPFNINTMMPDGAGLVKATRAPWFTIIERDSTGNSFAFITPSQIHNIDPPNTVGTAGIANPTMGQTDINTGLLKIFTAAGTELPAGSVLNTFVDGLFIFQGME